MTHTHYKITKIASFTTSLSAGDSTRCLPGPYVMLSETKHLALVLNKRNCGFPAFPFGQLPKGARR